jgi:hypothetical protein
MGHAIRPRARSLNYAGRPDRPRGCTTGRSLREASKSLRDYKSLNMSWTLLQATPFLIVLSAGPRRPRTIGRRCSSGGLEGDRRRRTGDPGARGESETPGRALRPGKDGVGKSHHETPKDDPYYIWLGSCPANCAIALANKDAFVDLTGLAKIRWRTKADRVPQPSAHAEARRWHVAGERLCRRSVVDWHESEFAIAGFGGDDWTSSHRRRSVGGESGPEPGR